MPICYYDFKTRLLTPVLQLEDPLPGTANLAASRDGRTVWFAQGEQVRGQEIAPVAEKLKF